MARIAAKINAILIAALLASCKSEKKSTFFDQPAHRQIELAHKLPTQQVYQLYKSSFDLPPPPTPHLQAVLGERGEETLVAWVSDLENEDPLTEAWEYGPLLSAIKDRSRLTLCDQPQLFRLASQRLSIRQSVELKKMERHLAGYC